MCVYGSPTLCYELTVDGDLQIINRNRFITNTRDLSRARRHPPTEALMGYMITNFNDITFEDGNVLEMCLDWFDAYTAISAVPGKYLGKLLKGECGPSYMNTDCICFSSTQCSHVSSGKQASVGACRLCCLCRGFAMSIINYNQLNP